MSVGLLAGALAIAWAWAPSLFALATDGIPADEYAGYNTAGYVMLALLLMVLLPVSDDRALCAGVAGLVRGPTSSRACLVVGAVALLTLASCSSGEQAVDVSELSLREGVTRELSEFGVLISPEEADCFDEAVSAALGLSYPATWVDYRAAMDERMDALASVDPATIGEQVGTASTIVIGGETFNVVRPEGLLPVDPIPVDMTLTRAGIDCLSAEHLMQLDVWRRLGGTRTWSDLDPSQQQCLTAVLAPFQDQPGEGPSSAELESLCLG